MNKRIVILHDKETGEETPFSSVSSLVRESSDKGIGIGVDALYNALSRNGGWYENQRVKIFYKTINITPEAWD